jgi:hypothetical protein
MKYGRTNNLDLAYTLKRFGTSDQSFGDLVIVSPSFLICDYGIHRRQ